MIAHYYLLPRYASTPTLLTLTRVSFYYFIISLVSIDFLVNCHTCFTLFSINSFFRGLEGYYGLYRTFRISNLILGPRLGFFIDSFSKKKNHIFFHQINEKRVSPIEWERIIKNTRSTPTSSWHNTNTS